MPSGFPFSRIATRVPSSLSGVLYSTAGVLSAISTTGSGNAVLATSPTLITPTIASLIGNKIYPASDGTAAIQFNKADGTTKVVTIDTTNGRLGIGTSPLVALDVVGDFLLHYGGNIYTTEDNGEHKRLLLGITRTGAPSTEYFTYLQAPDNDYNDGIALKNYAGATFMKFLPQGGGGTAFPIATFTAPVTSGAISSIAWKIVTSYNQSGSTTGTDLLISRSETALGSGNQYLILCQAGTSGTTDKFWVSNSGGGYFSGNVGIGTSAPNAKLESLSTTEQLRLSYDSTHYVSWTTNSSGNLTIAPSGETTTITGAMTIGSSGQATITSGGYAQLGWGSASTPAHSFSSATNYGIYYASSAVRISAAGSEVARFSAGGCTAIQFRLSALNTAPSSASDTGTLGEIRIVDGYIYVCTATNTWKRSEIVTW